MSSRTYLSIGDVLTLLREEFPDVTISKIRFLESQGLVNPERSPSGYRKFFDTDVERLRWVLRQQREHFLPLKVIRDRLSEGDLGEGDGADGAAAGGGVAGGGRSAGEGELEEGDLGEVPDPVRRNGKVHQAAHAAATVASGGAGPGGSAGAGAGASGPGTGGRPVGSTAPGDAAAGSGDDVMARILADASRRTAQLPDNAAERPAALRVVGDKGDPGVESPPAGSSAKPERAPAAGVAGMPGDRSTRPPASAGGGAVQDLAGRRAGAAAESGRIAEGSPSAPVAPPKGDRAAVDTRTGAASARGTGAAAASQGARAARGAEPSRPKTAPAAGESAGRSTAGVGSGAAGGGTTAGRPADSLVSSSMVTGASLTTEELCAASGLSEIELAGLQGFGLIEGEVVAGILTFNEEALTVANLAAEFRRFGIEPRHLRLYRNAVDRELGLIEQVIIPLLRQRNPESRQRAVESAAELGNLGQMMRATMLRAALRRHVGG